MTNQDIANKLRDHARELAQTGDNLYRVRAVRQAVMAVLQLQEPVEDLVTSRGTAALTRIPGIGSSLAETIAKYAVSGKWIPHTAPNRAIARVG